MTWLGWMSVWLSGVIVVGLLLSVFFKWATRNERAWLEQMERDRSKGIDVDDPRYGLPPSTDFATKEERDGE